jgi:hypothetical protein
MNLHDVVQDFLTTITKIAGFHVLQEQTHVLTPLPYNFYVVKLTYCY